MRISVIFDKACKLGKKYIVDNFGTCNPEDIDKEENIFIDGAYQGFLDGYKSGVNDVVYAMKKAFNELVSSDASNCMCKDYEDIYELRERFLNIFDSTDDE